MTSSRRIDGEAAFTLVEFVLVILLMGILAGVSIPFVRDNQNAQRYQVTKAKLEALRAAILGDSTVDAAGSRTHFGYVGDMGRLPTALSNLTTAETPAFSFDSTYGFGSGWRGPYVSLELIGTQPVDKDEWGNSLVYSPSASPPTITSYGADGAAGGTSFNTDITVTLPVSESFATVDGVVADGATAIAGLTTEIRYPVSGTQTAFTVTTSSNGTFSFPSVPFGFRSLKVTSTPSLGPVQIVVDQPSFVVVDSALNYSGAYLAVTVSGSPSTACTGSSCARVSLKNAYSSALTLANINADWSPTTGYLKSVILNGTTQTIPAVPPGTDVGVTAALTIPARSPSSWICRRAVTAAETKASSGRLSS